MPYLLDTNVLSELRRQRPHPGVRAWAESTSSEAMFLSALVIGEVRKGIEVLRRRDASQALALDIWLSTVLHDYEDRVLPVTAHIAEEWGRFNVPDPVSTIDGLLAATARVHGLTLVTRNVKDVARTGVPVLDPFALA